MSYSGLWVVIPTVDTSLSTHGDFSCAALTAAYMESDYDVGCPVFSGVLRRCDIESKFPIGIHRYLNMN